MILTFVLLNVKKSLAASEKNAVSLVVFKFALMAQLLLKPLLKLLVAVTVLKNFQLVLI